MTALASDSVSIDASISSVVFGACGAVTVVVFSCISDAFVYFAKVRRNPENNEQKVI
jgi:hypothetical protein